MQAPKKTNAMDQNSKVCSHKLLADAQMLFETEFVLQVPSDKPRDDAQAQQPSAAAQCCDEFTYLFTGSPKEQQSTQEWKTGLLGCWNVPSSSICHTGYVCQVNFFTD